MSLNLFHKVSFLIADVPQVWYAIPLIVAVSLVYGATRHEHLREIIEHSIRSVMWVVCFMAIIFFLIWIAGYWN